MDEGVEDEKKPYEAEGAQDDDTQPDPDETLMLTQGGGRVWMVKIPGHLLQRWSAINDDQVHLATIRVYNETNGLNGKKPRIVLFLPPYQNPSNPPPPQSQNSNRPLFPDNCARTLSDAEPDCYELELVNDAVENQMIVAERPKDASFNLSGQPMSSVANNRARTTILTGRVKHDCNLRPAFTSTYRKQMRERHQKYNTPVRQIKMIEEAGVIGGRGGINRLSSGVGMGAGAAFGDLIKTKPKPAKGQFERMARMPRNQLLDLIFQLFRDTPRWGIKALREKTQQPEVYLKETLSDVAFLHRSGEHNGLWEIKESFQTEGIKGENIAGPSYVDTKMEVDEDDDEDEDDDMEEVS